jgi:plastocyanin
MQNIWIWIVVAVVVIGGGFWWWQSTQTPVANVATSGTDTSSQTVDTGTQNQGTSVNTSGGTSTGAPMSATVTYDGSSFSPASVTIAQGGSVTFTSAGGGMWVASNPHPVHTGYDGTSMQQHCAAGYTGAAPFDQCSGGTSYTFTFSKVGSWGYHNHLNPGAGGTVIVQ